ncbi:MAG TPA: nitroreductase family protein, partial [Actinomycetota bacterium]|nr:nitroreductase family protein [Actinomycetota bacterium]
MVRRFTGDPVPEDRLARILDTGRRGPSAGNTQACDFVVVTDADRRGEIAAIAGEPDYVARGFDPWLSSA